MSIWSSEIKELQKLYESFKSQLPDLEKELERLLKTDDENIILVYSRRCLEVIITDLCECELKRPRKTEPLKGIIDKLNKEEKVPSNIITSMDHLNSLSAYGAHPKDFDPEQVKPVLVNLDIIIKWYLKYKDTNVIHKVEVEDVKDEIKLFDDTTGKIHKSYKKLLLIISGGALVVIVVVVLFVFNIIGRGNKNKEPEKSIAVLPFKYLSDEPDKQYLADGMMDAILLHLSKIKDLRVMDRTSVEQFRGTTKTTSEISKELDVVFLLEGSFQKYEDNVRLIVQLIKASEKGHVWANEYNNKWSEIFSVQSEVAQSIAKELSAAITPYEKQVLNKIPTSDLTAYDLFLKANEFREEYRKTHDLSSYQTAVILYTAASEIDSTFAQAYIGLAWAYYDRFYWPEYFKEGFLDSCLVLNNIALSIDDKLYEGYYLKGQYYWQKGNIEEALINFDKTIEINPNFYSAYAAKGSLYTYNLFDIVKGLENYHKALTLVGINERPSLLMTLGNVYADLGFFDKAKYYFQEAFKISNNQINYLLNLRGIEWRLENYEETLNLCKKCLEIDSTIYINLHFYLYAPGHTKEAYIHAKKLIESFKKSGTPLYYFSHRIGYTFYKVGKIKEADYYFKQQIRYSEESIKLNRPYAQRMAAHYDLSATYAFLGDKTKAYQHLDEYNTMAYIGLSYISFVESDPLYESIRDEERFQKIVQNMKAKNKAKHEEVRNWLEEQGML